MFSSLLTLAVLLVPGIVTGALAGGLTARWLLARQVRQRQRPVALPPDPQLAARIDRAAATWAHANGRPEAAGLVADKLHLLHRLGKRQGRFQ